MTSRMRRAITVLGLTGALAVIAMTAGPGLAQGPSPAQEELEAHGWICVLHPFAAPRWYRCFNPGVGRPFPGNPDPAPTYNSLMFDVGSGAYVGTGHMIRGDLYSGQPCGPSGAPYAYLPLIGYYDCIRT